MSPLFFLRTLESDPYSGTGKTLVATASNALLFMLIFGMAGTVDVMQLKRQLNNRYAIVIGVIMQFVIMPLLGFLSVTLLKDRGLTPPMGIALLIVTASPGGSYSNWWCSLFNADLALSVAMTAISTILSIILLPANLLLYAHAAYGSYSQGEHSPLKSIDFVSLLVSLVIVIGAILLGLFVSYKQNSARFREISNKVGSVAGITLIIFSAIFLPRDNDGPRPWQQDWTFFVGVGGPCVGGLIIANVVARFLRLKSPETVTIAVECCYQNMGIALSAVPVMFKGEEAAQAIAVPLFYGLVEVIAVGLYCVVSWKLGWTKAPHDDPLCKVLTTVYAVEDVDEEAQYDASNPFRWPSIRLPDGRPRVQRSISAREHPGYNQLHARLETEEISIFSEENPNMERAVITGTIPPLSNLSTRSPARHKSC